MPRLVRIFSALLAAVLTLACHDSLATPPRAEAYASQGGAAAFTYSPVDLGTLGGSTTVPFALNDSGVIVGYSTTADGSRRAFLWRDGAMSELATLAGGQTEAHAINAAGEVAGVSAVDPFFPFEMAVVVWNEGGLQRLESVGGSMYIGSVIKGINDDGDVLGNINFDDTHKSNRAILWRDDVFTDLGGLTARPWTLPATWNRRGQVVGRSFAYERSLAHEYFHPVVWDPVVGIQALSVHEFAPCDQHDERPCGFGSANDINDAGLIVGDASDSTQQLRAVYWDAEGRHELDVHPGQATTAVAVNDRGDIVGIYRPTRHHMPVGSFVWSGGTATELGSLGGGGTRALAITERGEVIGTSRTVTGEEHPFVWANGAMTDLGRPGETGTPVAINQRGDIVVRSRIGSGSPRGVLWRRGAPAAVAGARSR